MKSQSKNIEHQHNTSESNLSNTINNTSVHVINIIGNINKIEDSHIMSTSRAGYSCMLGKIITHFYDIDMQHLLVHIEELSQ